ncbi:DUF945 family protein [Orbaceae bacterium ESL0727]|nr:DUF945 family protein [Orbaceae bacterium ESL0727]
MKKSIIASGVIIAILAAGYIGTAWYTGNMIENNIDNEFAHITDMINNGEQDLDVAINYHDYQKNIFSTKLHLTITLSSKKANYVDNQNSAKKFDDEKVPSHEEIANSSQNSFGEDNSALITTDDNNATNQEPEKDLTARPITLFDDDITIHHGPFPLAALAKGEFAPQMAWVEYAMTEKASPQLWQLAGNKSFITAYAGMSYRQYLTLKMINQAINSHDEHGNNLLVSAGEFLFKADKDFDVPLLNMKLDKLSYTAPESTMPSLDINNLRISSQKNNDVTGFDYQFSIDDFNTSLSSAIDQLDIALNNIKSQGTIAYQNGNIDLHTTIDKITLKDSLEKQDGNYNAIINQVVIDQKNMTQATNLLNGSFKSTIGSLFLGKQNLGNGSLDIDYRGLDLNNINNRIDNHNLPIRISSISNKTTWHNTAGDIEANVLLGLSNVKSREDLNIDNLDALKVKLDMPSLVVAQTLAQATDPSSTDVTPEQLDKMDKNVQMMGRLFFNNSPIIQFQKNNVAGFYLDVDYIKGDSDVKVNDTKIKKEDFFKNF